MAEPLHFDLVSPERLVISEVVESVVLPGAEGYLTVLPLHAPLITTLKPGVLEVNGAGGTRRFYVPGGFADVTPAGLTVLADRAVPLEELRPEQLAQEIRDAEEDLADAGDNPLRRRTAETKLSQLRDAQRWVIPA
jgi:F-type H+-transporting ATPase subunit epsilon